METAGKADFKWSFAPFGSSRRGEASSGVEPESSKQFKLPSFNRDNELRLARQKGHPLIASPKLEAGGPNG